MKLTDTVNIDELEIVARERLTEQAYGYIASGANDERTLHDNRAAFERCQLLPRVLVDVSTIEMGVELFGTSLDWPVLLAPTAFQCLADPRGELASASAAAAAGTVFVASTLSSYALEEIAEAAVGPRWFQVYVASDRGMTEALVRGAEEAGYEALCLTVDVPVLGRREADERLGFHLPPAALPRNFLRFLDVSAAAEERKGSALARLIDQLFDPTLSWRDLAWLRSLTDLPIVIKGIMTADDAREALAHGVDGIVVSNHGGRQLDGVPATIDALPPIVDAVAGQCPILMDGGIRRGTDVLKALALGADATLVGRPYVWGLAAGGEAGVARALGFLRDELRTALALVGCPDIRDLDRRYIHRRPG